MCRLTLAVKEQEPGTEGRFTLQHSLRLMNLYNITTAYLVRQAFSEGHIVIHERLFCIFAVREIALLRVPKVSSYKIGDFSSLKVEYFSHRAQQRTREQRR